MKRTFGRNDANRAGMLQLAEQTNPRMASLEKLEPRLVTQAHLLERRFNPVRNQLRRLRSDRVALLASLNDGCRRLTLMLRAAWYGLEHRQKLQQHKPSLLLLYGLDMQGHKPSIRARKDLLTAAQNYILGEQTAQKMGYEHLAYPHMASFKKSYDETRANLVAAEANQLAIQKALSVLGPLRSEVDGWIKRVGAYLDYALRERTGPQRRRVMRLYGFRFHSSATAAHKRESTPSEPSKTNPQSRLKEAESRPLRASMAKETNERFRRSPVRARCRKRRSPKHPPSKRHRSASTIWRGT